LPFFLLSKHVAIVWGEFWPFMAGQLSRHEGHNQATIQTLRVIKIDEHFKTFPTGGLLYPTMILTALEI
jgi:hypothetical protein